MADETPEDDPPKTWLLWLPLIALLLAAFVGAYMAVDPAPPTRLRMATGSPQGAYQRYAERYRDALLERGVTLELVSTGGSGENLELLDEGEVDLAFVQGGVSTKQEHPRLRSLGSVYREPLWVFVRGLDAVDLRGLAGKRVAVGSQRSGTRAVALRLLADCGVAESPTTLVELGGAEAAAALRAGELDALFLSGSPQIPQVSELLADARVRLLPFRRAAAFTRHHRYLSRVVLHEGVVDLAANLPARDVPLVASAATLVTTEDLHPSSGDLLLQACQDVHGLGGPLEDPGEFPSPLYVDYPLTASAKRFHTNGMPLLYRALPFWVASVVARFWVMLLPLVTLLLPLSRVVPLVYAWAQNSKILKLYEQLHAIEREGRELAPEDLEERLEAVRARARKTQLPNSYRNRLHAFWIHLAATEQRLSGRVSPETASHSEAAGEASATE